MRPSDYGGRSRDTWGQTPQIIPTILLNLSNLALYLPLFKLAIASVLNDSILKAILILSRVDSNALRIDSISAFFLSVEPIEPRKHLRIRPHNQLDQQSWWSDMLVG